SITGGVTTWSDLFTQIAAGLGIQLLVDPISANYLKPATALATQYEALSPVLDVACFSTGLRFVRGLDGTCRATSVDSALATTAQQLLIGPSKQAGGLYSLGPTGLDNTSVLPQSVSVAYPRLDGSTPNTNPTVYTKTLASLNLLDFPAVQGFS